MLYEKNIIYEEYIKKLTEIYSKIVEPDYSEQLNLLILNAYQEILNTINIYDINKLVINKPFIKNLILLNYEKSLLHRQPIILLLYYLILKKRTTVRKLWPLTDDEIASLYGNLGLSFSD